MLGNEQMFLEKACFDENKHFYIKFVYEHVQLIFYKRIYVVFNSYAIFIYLSDESRFYLCILSNSIFYYTIPNIYV